MRGELGGLGEQLLFGDHQLYNTLTTSDLMLYMMTCRLIPSPVESSALPYTVQEAGACSALVMHDAVPFVHHDDNTGDGYFVPFASRRTYDSLY